MITKKQMDEMHRKHEEAKKDFKNRCFFVIETLVGEDMGYSDIDQLGCDIYEIAHIGTQTCEHKDWAEKMEKMFKTFENEGLI